MALLLGRLLSQRFARCSRVDRHSTPLALSVACGDEASAELHAHTRAVALLCRERSLCLLFGAGVSPCLRSPRPAVTTIALTVIVAARCS